MRRRAFIALATAGLGGCVSGADSPDTSTSTDSPIDETATETATESPTPSLTESPTPKPTPAVPALEDERVYEMSEPARYGDVQIQGGSLLKYESVEYNNPEEATIKTWDPGEGKSIIVAGYSVENLGTGRYDWPVWENFHLVTPNETLDPIVETPDGSDISEIEVPVISWPKSSGLGPNKGRGWNGLYVGPSANLESYAIKWTRPDENLYWRESA